MENQIFSMARFGAYLKKFFAEYRNLHLQFIIMTGLLTFFMFVNGGRLSFVFLTFVLFVFAISSATRMSVLFSERAKKIKFLLVPASQFEKLLAMVVYLYIYIPLMYIAALFLAQYCASIITAMFALTWPHFEMPFAAVEIYNDLLIPYIMSYMTAVSFYLMGATIFTKHSFLRTTCLALAVGLIFTVFTSMGVAMHAFSVAMMSRFDNFGAVIGSGATFLSVMNIVVTLLFLAITYMRITEMEANETKK